MGFKYNATIGTAATANLLGSFKYSFTFKSEMMAIKTSIIITPCHGHWNESLAC